MLDKRLNAIFNQIGECNVLADIGTDHGLLCLTALKMDKAKKVIATDISDKSIQKAINLLTENGFENNCEFRVGDGLSVLSSREADVIVVSGMGGREICKMINSAQEFSSRFILSPQSDVKLVRQTLLSCGFEIISDFVVLSQSKFYDIIVAQKGAGIYTEFELEYGKISHRAKSEDYILWLDKEIEKATNLSRQTNGEVKEMFVKREQELLSIKSEIYGG